MADGIFDLGNIENQANQAITNSEQIKPETGFSFSNLLEDPNFIRALGSIGRIGGEGSVGDILGSAGSELVRRRAVQEAGANQLARQENFQQKLINALANGSLLSPTQDNTRPDSITLTGDGGATVNFKNTPQTPGFAGEQTSLEADRGFGGNTNLRDFLSSSLG